MQDRTREEKIKVDAVVKDLQTWINRKITYGISNNSESRYTYWTRIFPMDISKDWQYCWQRDNILDAYRQGRITSDDSLKVALQVNRAKHALHYQFMVCDDACALVFVRLKAHFEGCTDIPPGDVPDSFKSYAQVVIYNNTGTEMYDHSLVITGLPKEYARGQFISLDNLPKDAYVFDLWDTEQPAYPASDLQRNLHALFSKPGNIKNYTATNPDAANFSFKIGIRFTDISQLPVSNADLKFMLNNQMPLEKAKPTTCMSAIALGKVGLFATVTTTAAAYMTSYIATTYSPDSPGWM